MPRIDTNTTYESFFWVEWNQVSQDIPGNKTKISWACGVSCGHSFYLNAIKMSAFTINGVQVYGGGTYSNFSNGNHTIASGTLDISHDTNGQKTFSISSFTGWLYSNHNYSSNGGSFSLQQIPRKATITASADFTDQQNPSITISNPGGFPMDVWLEPNPVGDHLCVRNGISLDANGKYTWAITDDEREQLRNCCPGKDCTIRVGVYTHIGDTVDADYRDKKFIMVESAATKPDVDLYDVWVDNGSLSEKFKDLYIQGKSRVNVILEAEGKYGAGIQSSYVEFEGRTYSSSPFKTNVIRGTGDISITGWGADERGFYNKDDQTLHVIAYAKPLVATLEGENAIQCYRSDGNGKRVNKSTSVWVKAKRSYYGVDGKNQCALQWRRKPASNIWNDATHLWNDLIPKDATTDVYNALIPGVEFDNKTAYTVQIKAIDDIGEFDIKTFEIPTEDVALHLGAGGKKVSVGTYCPDNIGDYTFYSAWKGIFPEGINGLYIHTKQVTGEYILIKTKFDDWEGTGEEYQTFILFGGHEFGPMFIVGHVGSAGGVVCMNADDSARFRDSADGAVEMNLPRVADGKFTVISADPIEIL